MNTTENPTVIIPYLFRDEIQPLLDILGFDVPYLVKEDVGRIGSDMMYQTMWNSINEDIIILHSDMLPVNENWYDSLCNYAYKYEKAGILGCKLLYPTLLDGVAPIQSAGGLFVEGKPEHYGSGIDLYSNRMWKQPEKDLGQYDNVREVAWTTFGGVYIKRAVLNQVGNFDNTYEQQYNRDVDYCLEARKHGWKIYQVPVPILHYESRDNKRIRDNSSYLAEERNLKRLQEKWGNTEFFQTINKVIE